MALRHIKLPIQEKIALKELLEQIQSEWPNARFVLFGSHALGAADKESDLDILIELPCNISRKIRRRLVHQVFDLNLRHNTNISILLVSKNEWENGPLKVTPIYTTILSEGIPL